MVKRVTGRGNFSRKLLEESRRSPGRRVNGGRRPKLYSGLSILACDPLSDGSSGLWALCGNNQGQNLFSMAPEHVPSNF